MKFRSNIGDIVKPLVTLVDRALPRPAFLELKRAIVSLGEERFRTGYQTTFWFDFKSEPTNLVEQAVLQLREKLPAKLLKKCVGVEWWLSRMRTSNVKVDFHRDRDNALFDSTGEEVSPAVSTLLYLNACTGGLLAVTRDDPNPENQAMAPDRFDFDLVAPAENRFVFFDGQLTHGVLDARNQIPGQRLPREETVRLAIAMNFWNRIPLEVPTYSASAHYRKLRLR